jgi:hypothetical protein
MWAWLKKLLTIPPAPISSVSELAKQFTRDTRRFGTWMERNIWYVRDYKWSDEWKAPEQTLAEGKGDCEDFARLAFAVLREMQVSYAEIVGLYPMKGSGHAICVFRDFNSSKLMWYDNGTLRNGCAPSGNNDADLKYICELSADRQGWQLAHWRKTGYVYGK